MHHNDHNLNIRQCCVLLFFYTKLFHQQKIFNDKKIVLNQRSKMESISGNVSNNTVTMKQESYIWTNYQICILILLGILTITTIIGNSLVLYISWKCRKTLRSATHLLIANLAVADLFVGAGVMPILSTVTILNWKWIWGDFFCTFSEYFHFSLCATSMLSIVAICVERYIGVRFPFRYKEIMRRNRILKFIPFIWILAILITATPLTVWPTNRENGSYVCQINLETNFVLFIAIGVYGVPVSLTILLYFAIYRSATKPYLKLASSTGTKVTKNSTSFDSMSTSTTTSNLMHRMTTNALKLEEHKYLQKRSKQAILSKKITIVVSTMIVFYAPLFGMFLIKATKPEWFSLNLLLTFAWLRYTSSCVNAFMYAFAVPGYKTALLKIFWNETSKGNVTITSNSDSDDLNMSSTKDYGHSLNSSNTDRDHSSFLPERITTDCLIPINHSMDQIKIVEVPLKETVPTYPDSLLSEIQIVLNSLKGKSQNININQHETQTSAVSLTTFAPMIKDVDLRFKSKNRRDQVKELRKSVITPIIDRRSQILQSKSTTDWSVIQELDEILEKIETMIIQPLLDSEEINLE